MPVLYGYSRIQKVLKIRCITMIESRLMSAQKLRGLSGTATAFLLIEAVNIMLLISEL